MSVEFVPVVDHPDDDGIRCEVWMNPIGAVLFVTPDTTYADPAKGWRRLYVQQEVPSDHSDRCEDDRCGESCPHLNGDGDCHCVCPKCTDDDHYCICRDCSRPAARHPHREVTS